MFVQQSQNWCIAQHIFLCLIDINKRIPQVADRKYV